MVKNLPDISAGWSKGMGFKLSKPCCSSPSVSLVNPAVLLNSLPNVRSSLYPNPKVCPVAKDKASELQTRDWHAARF